MDFTRVISWRKIHSLNTSADKYRRFFCVCRRSDSAVRVRFAPSPTGFLHLGGLRTALYNYLFAKSHGGSFLVRIEDTDRSRYITGATEKLLEILEWCQMKPDEGPSVGGEYGPYVQSQRLAMYRDKVNELLDIGSAYRCFCSDQRLELVRKEASRLQQIPKYDNRCRHLTLVEIERKLSENKPFAVRFKLKPIDKPFHDLVYGPISYDPIQSEGDPVILKSDGFPTYHLANVVDDHLMRISHVLRGVEWQVSTPKHVLLYEAFGWVPPKFAHLPLIVNSDGSKLSKRQGDLHVEHFKEQHYFPEALLSFVASMGGGFGKFEGIQVRDLSDLIDKFSLDKVNVNSCKLELDRLHTFNQSALQTKLSNDKTEMELVDATKRLVLSQFGPDRLKGGDVEICIEDKYILKVLHTFKSRIFNLNDLVQNEFAYVWSSPDSIQLAKETSKMLPSDHVAKLCKELEAIPTDEFTKDVLQTLFRNYAAQNDIKFNVLMKFVRLTVSGLTAGPAVGEMLEVLGNETTVQRLKQIMRAQNELKQI